MKEFLALFFAIPIAPPPECVYAPKAPHEVRYVADPNAECRVYGLKVPPLAWARACTIQSRMVTTKTHGKLQYLPLIIVSPGDDFALRHEYAHLNCPGFHK